MRKSRVLGKKILAGNGESRLLLANPELEGKKSASP